MLLAWIHLVTGIILLVTVIGALSRMQTQVKIWAVIARICYVFLLVSGMMMLSYAWRAHPVLTVLKVLLAVILVGVIEMAFARKTQKPFYYGAIILALIVAGVGLVLTGGFPLF